MGDSGCNISVVQGDHSLLIHADTGMTLQKALLNNDAGFGAPCGGKGTCGKCKVRVSGLVSDLTESERSRLTEQELAKGVRLACQVIIQGNVEVEAPDEKSAYIQIEGLPYQVNISPLAKRARVTLAGTGLDNSPDDINRLMEALNKEDYKISPATLSKISRLLHGSEQEVLVTSTEDALVDINPLNQEVTHDYGFAVDIGSTTIVGYLVNMKSGEIEETISQVNEQIAFGSDVLSRISYGIENLNGHMVLHERIVHQLSSMLKKAVERKGISKEDICGMTLAGNTIMMHFLMGLNPQRIAVAPFTPVFTSSYLCAAGEIGFDYHPQCPVYLLPSVSGYVGADIMAGILACSLHDENKVQLLVDIGTNGEMALSKKGAILCCSVAAGPAFEGAKIRCGVGGIEGAIDAVSFEDGHLKVHTLANKKPIGLCGSGLVDAVALMVQYGIIDEGGHFTDIEEWSSQAACLSDRLQTLNGEKVFIISEKNGDSVFLCQQDIREVQLAKAAVHAGIITLLQHQDIDFNSIDVVWLAGGFGNKIKKVSAVNIGLLPKELYSKIHFAGNTSGVGTIMALLSKECRDECDTIKKKAQYLELSGLPGFNDAFIQAIGFDI